MERIPNGRYTKEFREEAVKMSTEEGLSVLEISKRLSLPKSTLEYWIRVSKAGHLDKIGKGQRPLPDVERELATISDLPMDANIYRRGGVNVFPLYLYPPPPERKKPKMTLFEEANLGRAPPRESERPSLRSGKD
jgi:transposase